MFGKSGWFASWTKGGARLTTAYSPSRDRFEACLQFRLRLMCLITLFVRVRGAMLAVVAENVTVAILKLNVL